MNRTIVASANTVLAASLLVLASCEEKSAPPAPSGASTTPAPAPAPEHKDSGAGHGGPVIDLGSSTIGPFDVKAMRDQGVIVAGKDAPIDVTVTPSSGATAKAAAVRFWIGTQDAKGSVKAKADIENPAEPNRWHTHAEVPNPLPENSMLWVEIEDDKGGTSTGSFALKM
jgi:hypothetical protein